MATNQYDLDLPVVDKFVGKLALEKVRQFSSDFDQEIENISDVSPLPMKKKGQVITTKVDREGKQMVEVKYENGTTGWSIPDALTNFIQDSVDHTGEFLSD